VRQQVSRVWLHQHRVPLSPIVVKALKELIEVDKPEPGDFVFPDRRK